MDMVHVTESTTLLPELSVGEYVLAVVLGHTLVHPAPLWTPSLPVTPQTL